jgi:hypothetical protein
MERVCRREEKEGSTIQINKGRSGMRKASGKRVEGEGWK